MKNPFRPRAETARAEAQRLAELEHRTRPATQAQELADELARKADALDDALAEHGQLSEAQAKRISTIGKSLDKSAATLADAARAADAALGALIVAADGHDQLVEQSRRELLAAGLRAEYTDGDERVSFDVGATDKGVQLPGRTWTRLDPVRAVYRAAYGALRSIGYREAEVLRRQYRTDLLDGLLPPLPAAYAAPAPAWRAEHAAEHAARLNAAGAISREPGKVDALEEKRRKHAEESLDVRARAAYAEARADLVARHGEAYVQAVELRRGLPLYAPRTELTEVS